MLRKKKPRNKKEREMKKASQNFRKMFSMDKAQEVSEKTGLDRYGVEEILAGNVEGDPQFFRMVDKVYGSKLCEN